MSLRCEDYPCCGHTDGLGCNWTPDYSDPHFLCDHETGECEVQNMLDEIEDDPEFCSHCGEKDDGANSCSCPLVSLCGEVGCGDCAVCIPDDIGWSASYNPTTGQWDYFV